MRITKRRYVDEAVQQERRDLVRLAPILVAMRQRRRAKLRGLVREIAQTRRELVQNRDVLARVRRELRKRRHER